MRRRVMLGCTVASLVLLAAFAVSRRAQFVAGGALVNLGFRLQDHLEDFDLHHHGHVSPEEAWREVMEQNELAAWIRKHFPRTARHPAVAMVVCMDARIDTSELVGDTRKYYYIVRTAGSVLSAKEEEMLELAVRSGVKALILTTHTDCAAEKAAKDPVLRAQLPALAQAVDEREARWAELLERPLIKQRIAARKLLVKRVRIDTATDEMLPEATTKTPVLRATR